MKEFYHTPALLHPVLEGLNLRAGGVYVDTTLGGGGHASAILRACPDSRVYAFDQDPAAVDWCRAHYQEFTDRLTIFQENFENIYNRLNLERIPRVDGILFDLGVSSAQLDIGERGFSFMNDGRLDMRMNPETEIGALEVVSESSRKELAEIFRTFGEERESWRIAGAIEKARAQSVIETTGQLAGIIEKASRSRMKNKVKARIFQALRIHVNREMDVLDSSLEQAVDLLKPGGRLVVIAYHSIEDRRIKQFFRYQEQDCICPKELPQCRCDKVSRLKIITRRPIRCEQEEIEANPRARSARLRIAEKKEEPS